MLIWTMAPLATGAISPAQDDLRIEVDVPVTTSVTPGWTTGETSIRMPNLTIAGEVRDVSSTGWRMSTNWVNGYQVKVRTTTEPALRGVNAVDGAGARASFADYATKDCPCPWNMSSFQRGVFGYSATVAHSSGLAATDTAKWGTSANRRWRGFTQEAYPIYATPGGQGQYAMSIHLRTMIPDGAVQPAGSYRASFIVSAHPLS